MGTTVKYKDLKNSHAKDLAKMDQESRTELFHLRIKQKTSQLANKSRVREVRRDVARVQTKMTDLKNGKSV